MISFDSRTTGQGYAVGNDQAPGDWTIPLENLATPEIFAEFEAEWNAYLHATCDRSTHVAAIPDRLKAACRQAFLAGYTLGQVR